MNKKESEPVAVCSLTPKSIFTYGGVNWVVLQRDSGGSLCLAEKNLFEKAFDKRNRNNWENSSLREYLNNDFLYKLISAGASKAAFLPMVTDLTADDGLNDYGCCEDTISLISCQQYRKYRGIIPNVNYWWWTCTAYSTVSNGYSYFVHSVYCKGTLGYNNAYSDYGGVRPLCKISVFTLVSPVFKAEGTDGEAERERTIKNHETNADRIRSMDDEELADYLMDVSMGLLFDKKVFRVLPWLQQPAESEE